MTDRPPQSAASLRSDWRRFYLLSFLFYFGFAVYSGVFQNYLRDVRHAEPLQLGYLESLREIPGLLTALTAGVLVAFTEARLAGLGLLVAGIGIAGTGMPHTFAGLVAVTMLWSIGFHIWVTVAPAITLNLSAGHEGGRRLGSIAGVGSIATFCGLAAAWQISILFPASTYSISFWLAGASIAGGAIIAETLSVHTSGPTRARLIVRREYALYYLLSFLEGCRRQIFAIFASFTLIVVYHVPVQRMLVLQLVNAVLIAISAPYIGKLVDRRGERNPLTFYSAALVLVFIGYATTSSVGVLFGLFLIDNILFSFGVGFTTYLRRVVRPGELTPCLAMGTTMNHVAAVTVPVGGAWLWQHYQRYQIPFWAGAAIAVAALIATLALPRGAASSEAVESPAAA